MFTSGRPSDPQPQNRFLRARGYEDCSRWNFPKYGFQNLFMWGGCNAISTDIQEKKTTFGTVKCLESPPHTTPTPSFHGPKGTRAPPRTGQPASRKRFVARVRPSETWITSGAAAWRAKAKQNVATTPPEMQMQTLRFWLREGKHLKWLQLNRRRRRRRSREPHYFQISVKRQVIRDSASARNGPKTRAQFSGVRRASRFR